MNNDAYAYVIVVIYLILLIIFMIISVYHRFRYDDLMWKIQQQQEIINFLNDEIEILNTKLAGEGEYQI